MEKPTPNEATPRSKDPLVKSGPETPTLNEVPPRKDPLFESIMDHFELHYTRGGQAYVTHKQDDRGGKSFLCRARNFPNCFTTISTSILARCTNALSSTVWSS